MAGKHIIESQENNKTKEKNKLNIILLIFRLICIAVMLYSGYKIFLWQKENMENDKLKNSFGNVISNEERVIGNIKIDVLNIDFNDLLNRNSETVGWIKVNNTNINYPIVQHTDNDFYLTHNFEKAYNTSGWIYLDYRNKSDDLDRNTIVYGHNRWNESMFGTLKNALESSWCDNKDNRFINFSTISHKYVAEIFSVYKIDVNTLEVPNDFSTEDEYDKYLDSIKNLSYYKFNTTVSTDDKILTLYTCDNNSAYRVIVHAKLTELE